VDANDSYEYDDLAAEFLARIVFQSSGDPGAVALTCRVLGRLTVKLTILMVK
jgi:hypothetical protein